MGPKTSYLSSSGGGRGEGEGVEEQRLAGGNFMAGEEKTYIGYTKLTLRYGNTIVWFADRSPAWLGLVWFDFIGLD